MKKPYALGNGQRYVAGKRGIRFQNAQGVLESRKPGEPMPEAEDSKLFPNLRHLVERDRLTIEDIPKSSNKKPEDKKTEPPKDDKKPETLKDDKKSDTKNDKKPDSKKSNSKKPGKK